MNGVFLDYAKYYDALYKDKDYKSEVEFVVSLIKRFAPEAQTILNIGCGTGQHDVFLADHGYEVTGIDRSEQMIGIANQKNKSKNCHFIHADGRDAKLNQKFDVVISLFHVLSYQNTNSDVIDFLKTASSNLTENGICIIDYWYGPAVINIKPEKRQKSFTTETIGVIRNADTTIDYLTNVATVNFEIIVNDKAQGTTQVMHEKHPMRYFFSPEMSLFADLAGMKELHQAEWMKLDLAPSENSWSAYSILKK